MSKPQIENLKAQMQGRELNIYQKADALIEFNKLLNYVSKLEQLLVEINTKDNRDYAIASGGGRMKITMDRYGADWSMVQKGWER